MKGRELYCSRKCDALGSSSPSSFIWPNIPFIANPREYKNILSNLRCHGRVHENIRRLKIEMENGGIGAVEIAGREAWRG